MVGAPDPGDPPVLVPVGQQLRRWGALVALAGVALPGVTVASVVDAGGDLPGGDAWVTMEPGRAPAARTGETPSGLRAAAAAPWEAGLVEVDGKPLPVAPPPGPVPVDGIPQVAAAPKPTRPASAERAGDLVPADREYLRPILTRYAQENGLSADLVMSLAWVESSWRRNAVSSAGAVGVMQLMPNTVDYVSKKLLGLRSRLDPDNPRSNVRMGARYLRHLLDQNRGNVRQALIAYNQGPTSLRANGSYEIAERYADRVLALRPRFRSA